MIKALEVGKLYQWTTVLYERSSDQKVFKVMEYEERLKSERADGQMAITWGPSYRITFPFTRPNKPGVQFWITKKFLTTERGRVVEWNA